MESTTLTMLTFFILLASLSIWKLRAFFSTKELEDDDRNDVSTERIYGYIYEVLSQEKSLSDEISMEVLFTSIQALESFDQEHFWRLTPHRIRQLVQAYYMEHDVDSLESMFKREQKYRL